MLTVTLWSKWQLCRGRAIVHTWFCQGAFQDGPFFCSREQERPRLSDAFIVAVLLFLGLDSGLGFDAPRILISGEESSIYQVQL